MGTCLSSKKYSEIIKCFSLDYIPTYAQYWKRLPHDYLNLFSIIQPQDQDRKEITEVLNQIRAQKAYDKEFLGLDDNKSLQKCIASLLGLAICDALGASTEFQPFTKQGYSIISEGFKDIKTAIDNGFLDARAGKIGIWTDDCSMALCIADSLIYNNYQVNPKHIRYLFLLWFFNGLNNGGRDHSIGLGGNIKISMEQFMQKQDDVCALGDQFNNGNGSLMRLAPIPIAFKGNQKLAMTYSQISSRTTHNGLQAKECCRLLSLILTSLYNDHHKDPKEVIELACNRFETECLAVKHLALSQQQTLEAYEQNCKRYGHKFIQFNRSINDRNWNWKSKEFTYSETRAKHQPGYVGSYCMDALAMALHTVWTTNSFKEVALVNANMGGDCDTVGAIAGQIAGAMYGLDKEMLKLYFEMEDCREGRYQVFLKAFKLAHHKQ